MSDVVQTITSITAIEAITALMEIVAMMTIFITAIMTDISKMAKLIDDEVNTFIKVITAIVAISPYGNKGCYSR